MRYVTRIQCSRTSNGVLSLIVLQDLKITQRFLSYHIFPSKCMHATNFSRRGYDTSYMVEPVDVEARGCQPLCTFPNEDRDNCVEVLRPYISCESTSFYCVSIAAIFDRNFVGKIRLLIPILLVGCIVFSNSST